MEIQTQTIEFITIPKATWDQVFAENKHLKTENLTLQAQLREFDAAALSAAKETIEELQEENRQLKEENKQLKARLEKMENRVSCLESEKRKLRNLFLMGSLGYNMIDVALQFVYSETKLKAKRRQIKSILELEKDQLSDEERQRLDEFKALQWDGGKIKWDEDWEELIYELTNSRVGLAHPTTFEEGEDAVISPEQLQTAAKSSFNSHKSIGKLTQVHAMVDFLDQITRLLQRPLLS